MNATGFQVFTVKRYDAESYDDYMERSFFILNNMRCGKYTFDDLVEIVVGTDGQTGGEDVIVHIVDGIFGTQFAPILVVFGVENMLGERIGVIFGGVHF